MRTYQELSPKEEAQRQWDEVMTEAGLLILDPREQEGLVEKIPVGIIPVKPLHRYDTGRTLGEKMGCAKCGHSRNHFKGLTVLLPDGRKALVGNECGAKDFGENIWVKFENSMVRQEAHAFRQACIEPYKKQLQLICAALNEWIKDAMKLDKFFIDLQKILLTGGRKIREFAERGEPLSRTKTVVRPIIGKDGQQREMRAHEIEPFGTVPAPSQMFSDSKLAHQLSEQRVIATEMYNRFNSIDGVDAFIELKETTDLRNDLKRRLKELRDVHLSAMRIFETDNLNRVLDWATKDRDIAAKYRKNATSIIQIPNSRYARNMLLEIPNCIPGPPDIAVLMQD